MGRSGYNDGWDGDENYPPEFYYQAVRRSIAGKRGQAFLRELAKEMDAMPVKALVAGDLVTPEGDCCTMGVVCKARGISVQGIDETDAEYVGAMIGIAPAMAREIAFENDDDFRQLKNETPEQRWVRMRAWVAERLAKP